VRFAGALGPLQDEGERALIEAELVLFCDFAWCRDVKTTFVEVGDDPEREGYEIFSAAVGFDHKMDEVIELSVSCGEENQG